MKLVSLRVEHFRAIRKAKLDFAAGLNVLHGPNDLGKSSLAHAIRAALLLQTTAREAEEFLNWQNPGEPLVELVFESEPQRIWKVQKTFGTSSCYLYFSRDGVDYQTEARGREVDGRLSEILRWGLAPPGGKGRPKGMPVTFLSTALLAEQDHVGAIFDQALGLDSDESGKTLLTSALQAMAEDPLFKNVLARVQERVDEAFSTSGKRKTGKNSPWVKWSDEILRKQHNYDERQLDLKKTGAIESEIQQFLNRQLEAREAVEKEQEVIAALQHDLSKQKARDEILVRVEERKARLAEITAQLQEVTDAEVARDESASQVRAMTTRHEEAQAASNAARDRANQAKEDLSRLQSADRVRKRQLEISTLETRRAGLGTEQVRLQASIDHIRGIEVAAAKVRALETDVRSLAESVAGFEKKREAASKARADLEDQDRELRGVRALLRLQAAITEVDQAEKALDQVNAWRKESEEKRAAAVALESAQPKFPLPTRDRIDDLRRLASERRVAAAKLDVGLSVTLRPKKPLRVGVQTDGGTPAMQEVISTVAISAQRQMRIDIEGTAEIAFSGGAADARQEMESLDFRWALEAAPLLQQAQVTSLDDLALIVNEAAQRSVEIQAMRREAGQLDQRIADQPDWARQLAERQQRASAAEKELTGADRPRLEKAARKLKAADAGEIEKRLEALRGKLNSLSGDENQQAGELAAANARWSERRNAAEEARAELERSRSSVDGDWQAALAHMLDRQREMRKEIAEIDAQIKRLAVAEDQNLAAAQKALAACSQKLAEAEEINAKAQQDLTNANLQLATCQGVLNTRWEAARKLDVNGACEALKAVEAELEQAPFPAQPVSDSILAAANARFDAALAQLKEVEDRVKEKRGALQQVGGDVAKQRAEDAATELAAVRERAQQVEIEFSAWELLRKTLREAEQEEGTHLGRALAEPVARRFNALTTGRYGELALGPNLETQGISVFGANRDVNRLSVGTRDQLSTVFRLTLAEHLKTTVILDDQLIQSDSKRMSWLRDLLREIAANIQVIVLTCRPDDYLASAVARGRGGKPADELPQVRQVDLLQFIER